MTCLSITSIEGFGDFLVWPTGCNYFFYLWIFGALFIILSFGLFKAEEKRKTEGEMISAMGVSSIAVSIISIIGTLIKNSSGVPMIQADILLYILASTTVIVLIWIFKD